jgi:flagellar hook-basal body complex protein FliE
MSPAMNDLRIKPFDFNQALAKAGLRPDGMPRDAGPAGVGGASGLRGIQGVPGTPGVDRVQGTSFQNAMSEALRGVSASQLESQRLQREVTLGNPTVSLEASVMAQQKASIGFQAVLQVRNRMVSAYTEVMNMHV